MRYLFKATQKILLVFGHMMRLFFLKVEYRGVENVRNIKEGPLLIVANHKSYMDSILIGTCLPFFSKLYPLRFMAKDEFFTNPLGALIFKIIGSYPSFNKQGIEKSTKIPIELLQNGEVVVIFPEGQRIEGNELGKFKLGAGFIASLLSDAMILPISIYGSDRILKSLFSFKNPRLRINIGTSFTVKEKIKDDQPIDPSTALSLINKEIASIYYG